VSPVKYELGFYNPEDSILHFHCRENLKSYTFDIAVDILLVSCTKTAHMCHILATSLISEIITFSSHLLLDNDRAIIQNGTI
jgi:hypothetical protein